MCASPSAHSDSSSGNGRLSSAGSEAGGLNNNNNNCNTKFGEILRSKLSDFTFLQGDSSPLQLVCPRFPSSVILICLFPRCSLTCYLADNNGLHQQYNVEELHNANRMAVIANMVGQGGVPPGLGSDTSAAANIAAANIANLAMRLGVTQVFHLPCPCFQAPLVPLERLLISKCHGFRRTK